MARVSKVDSCMFCGEAPCICNKKPATAKTPRKRREPIAKSNTGSVPSSLPLPAEKPDVASAMRAAAKVHHVGATIKEERDSVEEQGDITADPEFMAAIRAVAPIMHPTERTRFRDILQSEPTAAERAVVWKQKRAGL